MTATAEPARRCAGGTGLVRGVQKTAHRPGRALALVRALAVATSLGATPVSAQIAWDTPRMIGPETPAGLGVYWTRAEVLPGDDDAVFGTWALPATGGSVVLRGGFGKGVAEEEAVFGGVDVRAAIARHSDTQPFDVEWTGGAGFGVGEYLLVSVPFALSVGRSWSSGTVWFAPYVTAGIALDYRHGDSDFVPEEEFEVQATAGVGADVSFDSARRFILRFGGALGDRQAVAVGLMISGGS